ncbi:MAG: hypothetical protein WCB67_09180 [Solirubrobacteraceae bacterium]
MSARKLAAVLAVLCATALLVPVAAGAQTTPTGVAVTSFKNVPISGTAHNGKKFTGNFSVNQFLTRAGTKYAVGTLTGQIGHRSVTQSNVALPVQVGGQNGQAGTAATCPVLHLVLGPLDLNLLGLKVHLNQVVLDITAQSGPGNLLGNLVCSVANLLNQPALPVQQLTGLLNILQQLLNVPGLLNL